MKLLYWNISFNTFVWYLKANNSWDNYFTYIGLSLSWRNQLQLIFGLEDSNTNILKSSKALFLMFTLTFFISLSYMNYLERDNKSQVLWYTTIDAILCIFRLLHQKIIYLGHGTVCIHFNITSDLNVRNKWLFHRNWEIYHVQKLQPTIYI